MSLIGLVVATAGMAFLAMAINDLAGQPYAILAIGVYGLLVGFILALAGIATKIDKDVEYK